MGIVPKMVRKRNLLSVDRGCLLPGIKRKSNFVEVIAKENNYSLFDLKFTTRMWIIRGDQEGLFKLVIPNFIFKWYTWSNFRLLMASH
jgi:hypothetical protein